MRTYVQVADTVLVLPSVAGSLAGNEWLLELSSLGLLEQARLVSGRLPIYAAPRVPGANQGTASPRA